MHVRSAVPWALLFGVVLALGAARAQEAAPPPASPSPPGIVGRLEWVEGENLKLANGDVYQLDANGLAGLRQLMDVGYVREGDWVLLQVVPGTKRISRVERTVAPADAPPDQPFRSKRWREFEAMALTFARGDIVLVNGSRYTFDAYQNGVLIVGSEKARGSITISLSDVKTLERVEVGPDEAPVRPPSAYEPKPGDAVSVDGVIEGVVLHVTPTEIVINTTRDGQKTFLRALLGDIRLIDKARLQVSDPRAARQGASESAVAIEHDQGKLDAVKNAWTVRGTVRHWRPGSILLGLQIDIVGKGTHRILSPTEERQVLATLEPNALAGGMFKYLGSWHELRADASGREVVVAELSETSMPRTIKVEPVFPDVPEPFFWESPLLDGKFEVKLPGGELPFVPYADPKAHSAFVTAFEKGDAAHRAAALKGIAGSRNKEFLPYLLYKMYQEPDEKVVAALRETFEAFGAAGEEWITKFLKEGGANRGISYAIGGGEPVRREVRDPDRLLARALDLAFVVKSDRAYDMALSHVRAEDPMLRQAARALFFDDRPGAIEAVLGFLKRKLLKSAEANELLLEIDERRPGTLAEIAARLAPDPEFEKALAAEPADVAARKYLDRIRRELAKVDPSAQDVEVEVADARDAHENLEAVLKDLEALRQNLARACVAAAVGTRPQGADERRWRAEMFRRALVADPRNVDARRGLGAIYYEAASEMRQGVNLRAGPGIEYRVLRTVARDDRLAKLAPPEGGWAHVRAHGVSGYAPTDSLRESGDLLIVQRASRPHEEIARVLLAARALDWEGAARVDELLAKVRASQAEEVAASGEWARAYEYYREAAARAPGAYRWQTAVAYVRANPLTMAGAAVAAVLLIVGLLLPRAAPAPRKPSRGEGRDRDRARARAEEPEPAPESADVATEAVATAEIAEDDDSTDSPMTKKAVTG